MKRNGIEKILVILLFFLVLLAFSFAERDSRKLDKLYKTATLINKHSAVSGTVQTGPVNSTAKP
jgi:hypothetical protein